MIPSHFYFLAKIFENFFLCGGWWGGGCIPMVNNSLVPRFLVAVREGVPRARAGAAARWAAPPLRNSERAAS
ncbi:hypothetical protein CTM95_20515 [Photobacterium angustum]|nr:hypothetical protein CTM95_20515 [Photobacterium angustum]